MIPFRPLGPINSQPEIIRAIRDLEYMLRQVINSLNDVTDTIATQYLITVSNENPVAGDTVTITAQLATDSGTAVHEAGRVITWSSTNGGSFSSPTSVTDATGVATVDFTVSTIAGTQHVVTGTDTLTIAGSSDTITTVPGTAVSMVIVRQPSATARDGAVLTIQPIIGFLDANGNRTDDAGISVLATPSSGVTRGNNPVISVTGEASYVNLLLDDA